MALNPSDSSAAVRSGAGAPLPSTRLNDPEDRGRRGSQTLMLVAALYFAAGLLLFDVSRYVTFDEAIYLAEVQRGAEPIVFYAHRARGIAWLVAPLAALGAPLAAIRLWLTAFSALALWVAFRPWVTVMGRDAVLAAALFAASWPALLYASEVMPNLPAALAAVAASGFALWAARERGRARLLGAAGAAMCVLAVFRPTETVWLGAAMTVWLLARRSRPAVQAWLALAAGAAIGWIPWLVESFLLFDNPVQRFEDMSSATVDIGDVVTRVGRYLASAGGFTSAPQGTPVPTAAIVVALVLVLLVALGALRPGPSAVEVRTAALCMAGFAVPYLLLTDAVAFRFLLPAFGFAALPLAAGLRSLTRRRAWAVFGVVALVPWIGVNALVSAQTSERLTTDRAEVLGLARAVAPLVQRPCFLLVEGGYPQVALTANCKGHRLQPTEDRFALVDVQVLASEGWNVYGLARQEPLSGGELDTWKAHAIPGQEGWMLLQRPPTDEAGSAETASRPAPR